MAGAVANLQRQVADGHGIALVEPARRLEDTRLREGITLRLCRQRFDQEQVVAVRSLDRHAQRLGEFARTGGMVDMGVRPQDLLDRDPELRVGLADARHVAAGIDDRSEEHTSELQSLMRISYAV